MPVRDEQPALETNATGEATVEDVAVEEVVREEADGAQPPDESPPVEPAVPAEAEAERVEIPPTPPLTPAVQVDLPYHDLVLRVDALIADIEAYVAGAADADALYAEVRSALSEQRRVVREHLGAGWEALETQQKALHQLYQARARLIPYLSEPLRAEITGGDPVGMRELRGEISYIAVYLGHQALSIPRAAIAYTRELAQGPLAFAWKLLELAVLWMVFAGWRRWAREGLPRARKRLLAVRAPNPAQLRVARAIWYVESIRNPLEWLLLVWALEFWTEPGPLQELTAFLFTIAFWLLSARFAVAVINSLAARGAVGVDREASGLRLRSLRLVAAWLLLLGLGLDLTATYAGEGTLYTWVWRLFQWLSLPVLGLLLHWWRPEIFRRLAEVPQPPQWVARAHRHRKGLRSYVTAAAGAIYLVGLGVLRAVVRRISRLDSGRRFLALLARTDTAGDDGPGVVTEPLPEDRRLALLTAPTELVNDAAGPELDRLRALVEWGSGGVIAVLSERGGGKTTLLRRLADAYPESTRWIDCPAGGFEPFRDALVSTVGLDDSSDPREDLAPCLKAAGIRLLIVDDLQRLAQPAMGGLRDIDLFSALISRAGEGVLCAVGLGRHAWSYISRASGDRIMMQEVLELSPWTETEVGALLDLRAQAASVKPDFRRLVLARQLDDGVHANLEDRNRFGFYRVIWDLASGNPEVAARLFADSLSLQASGTVRVRLPETPDPEAVNGSSTTVRIVLRVLVQAELASIDELVQSLRFTRAEVGNAVRFCLQRDWIEEIDGRFRLTWAWYRTITRVLARQNLLAR